MKVEKYIIAAAAFFLVFSGKLFADAGKKETKHIEVKEEREPLKPLKEIRQEEKTSSHHDPKKEERKAKNEVIIKDDIKGVSKERPGKSERTKETKKPSFSNKQGSMKRGMIKKEAVKDKGAKR